MPAIRNSRFPAGPSTGLGTMPWTAQPGWLTQPRFDPGADGFVKGGVAHDAAPPHLPLPHLELGLDQRDEPRLGPRQGEGSGQDEGERDEARIADDEIDGLGDLLGRQVAGIGALEHDDPRIVAQRPGQLAVADIHGVDPGSTTPQQDLREAAGRGADVDRDGARGIDPETVEPGQELQGSARDPVGAAPYLQRQIVGHGLPGLVEPTLAREDTAGEHERLGFRPRLGEAAIEEELIEAASGRDCSPMLKAPRSFTSAGMAVKWHRATRGEAPHPCYGQRPPS